MGKKYEKERAGGDSMQCAGGVVVMIPPDGEREPAMLMAEEFRGEGLCVLELEMSDLSTTRMEDMSVNSKESAYMFEAWVKRSGARMLLRMEVYTECAYIHAHTHTHTHTHTHIHIHTHVNAGLIHIYASAHTTHVT
jgi:hypothetical protein